jgi:hypothetical protein
MTDPNLTATALELLADALRARAGARLDKLAVVQRLAADLAKELAAKTRDEADELWTVAQASKAVGTTTVNMLKWVHKFNIGYLDPRSHIYLIYKSKLREVVIRRNKGTLPERLKDVL